MDYDYAVIGAGVVGLAIAELFARRNHSVLVIEKEPRIGTGISSRNSEVIHAGIYYPECSLKSMLCLKGKELLYEWCDKNNVSHYNCGKYIVASTEEESARLEIIRLNAAEAGMKDLHFRSISEMKTSVPEISTYGALFSPTTGILSAHEYMDSLRQKASENNADFVFNSVVKSCHQNSGQGLYKLEVADTRGEISLIEVGGIINAAGLNSDLVASVLGVSDDSYSLKFLKGNYFRLRGHSGLFKNLIYPVPMPKLHGLGVHITIDINGSVRFGPDVEPIEGRNENYEVSEKRKDDFLTAIRKYFPAIQSDDLMPDMAGIRPRLAADSEFNDFIIKEESKRGLPGIVNCVGIESPGLTASLAIAEYVFTLVH